jgi:signal transduction histidine kinase
MSVSARSAGPRRWWLLWAAAAGWWTLEGFTTATSFYHMSQAAGTGLTWQRALQTAMASAWLWVPLTALALWLAGRFPLDRDGWRRALPVHAAGALAACVARALAVVALNTWAGWYEELPPFRQVLLTSVGNNLFLYLMLVGVGHALVYARRYRERDEQLARAELRSLQMQLHPHFLFNTLNTVNALVRTDPDAAERMIARLSVLLRHALDGVGVQEVPLEEELRVLRSYLEIEQVRFEDRLRVEWRIAPETYQARVPHLLLQPLVENAIRHGITPSAAEGTVQIVAERRDGSLHLAVRDDGVGMRAPAAPEGVGLANTRTRLRQLYGARQSMEVRGGPHGGVHVEMRLPFAAERA